MKITIEGTPEEVVKLLELEEKLPVIESDQELNTISDASIKDIKSSTI